MPQGIAWPPGVLKALGDSQHLGRAGGTWPRPRGGWAGCGGSSAREDLAGATLGVEGTHAAGCPESRWGVHHGPEGVGSWVLCRPGGFRWTGESGLQGRRWLFAQVSGSSTFQGNPLLPPAARLVTSPALEAGAGLSLGVAGERSGPGGIWVRGQSCRWGSPGLWSPLALRSGPNSALVTCLQLSPWEANLKQRLCAGSRAGCEFRGRTCWGEGWAAGRHRSGPQPIACGGALS